MPAPTTRRPKPGDVHETDPFAGRCRVPLNRSYIGRSWTAPETYEVSRERLRDYVLAIDDPQPAYLDDKGVAPPTFATTLWFRMGTWPLFEPDFGKRAEPWFLLGDQEVRHHRPIRLGDLLVFSTTVRDIRTVGKVNELLEIHHRVGTTDGEAVCDIVDQMISRGSLAVAA
jgi:acyl dehydratase